jgi:four helix bundle protein
MALHLRRGFARFTSQLVEAAESVPTNIVEGCGAAGRKEFARFLDISIKSTMELEYQLQLARDNAVLDQTNWRSLTAETIEIRKMLCGLRRKLREASLTERTELLTY